MHTGMKGIDTSLNIQPEILGFDFPRHRIYAKIKKSKMIRIYLLII
jgi:hypothetical protein